MNNCPSIPLSLRKEIATARGYWLDKIVENKLKKREVKSATPRGVGRTIFVVIDAPWWRKVHKEISNTRNKIHKLDLDKRSLAKYMWLPTVIQNPEIVRVKIFDAFSVRTVSTSSARSFAKAKANFEGVIDSKFSYVIKSVTGRNYKLQHSDKDGSHYSPLPEWSVVVIKDESSLPKLKIQHLSIAPANRFENAICVSSNSGLFFKAVDIVKNEDELVDADDDDSDWV